MSQSGDDMAFLNANNMSALPLADWQWVIPFLAALAEATVSASIAFTHMDVCELNPYGYFSSRPSLSASRTCHCPGNPVSPGDHDKAPDFKAAAIAGEMPRHDRASKILEVQGARDNVPLHDNVMMAVARPYDSFPVDSSGDIESRAFSITA